MPRRSGCAIRAHCGRTVSRTTWSRVLVQRQEVGNRHFLKPHAELGCLLVRNAKRSEYGGSMISRRSLFAMAVLVVIASLLPVAGAMAMQNSALPSEISDRDFWKMIVDLSEPGG